MKRLRSQRGSIDIVLILVVFAFAALLGGYVYYRQQQNNKAYNAAGNGATVTKHTAAKKTSPTSSDPTTTSYPDSVYVGWKTYSSAKEKFTVKYPTSWTLTVQKRTETDDPKSENFTLTGPNNFTLGYVLYIPTVSTSCANCIWNGITKLPNTNYGQSLYMMVSSNVVNQGYPGEFKEQILGISSSPTIKGQPASGFPEYASKQTPGYKIYWLGEYGSAKNGEYVPEDLTYAEFVNRPEVTIAKQILASIKY